MSDFEDLRESISKSILPAHPLVEEAIESVLEVNDKTDRSGSDDIKPAANPGVEVVEWNDDSDYDGIEGLISVLKKFGFTVKEEYYQEGADLPEGHNRVTISRGVDNE